MDATEKYRDGVTVAKTVERLRPCPLTSQEMREKAKRHIALGGSRLARYHAKPPWAYNRRFCFQY